MWKSFFLGMYSQKQHLNDMDDFLPVFKFWREFKVAAHRFPSNFWAKIFNPNWVSTTCFSNKKENGTWGRLRTLVISIAWFGNGNYRYIPRRRLCGHCKDIWPVFKNCHHIYNKEPKTFLPVDAFSIDLNCSASRVNTVRISLDESRMELRYASSVSLFIWNCVELGYEIFGFLGQLGWLISLIGEEDFFLSSSFSSSCRTISIG